MAVDYTVIVLYLAGMLAMGWWGMRRAKSKSDFLVAGRRLGPAMYSGTMAAIVLGGASTIGGVGLGYQYGLSGAGWSSPSASACWHSPCSSPRASPA